MKKEKLNVFIMGETDYLTYKLSIENIDKSTLSMEELIATIGSILDMNTLDSNPLFRCAILPSCLEDYISRLKGTSKMIKKMGFKTIFLSAFRIDGGYQIRTAGLANESLSDNMTENLSRFYGLVKESNQFYKHDNYSASSNYHLMLMENPF